MGHRVSPDGRKLKINDDFAVCSLFVNKKFRAKGSAKYLNTFFTISRYLIKVYCVVCSCVKQRTGILMQ